MTVRYSAQTTFSGVPGIRSGGKISAALDSFRPLHRGIRNMLRCDEAAVVEGIAHYVISEHSSLRLLSTIIERARDSPFPGFIALIGWLRSFLSVRASKRRGGAVWIARLTNERRAIEPFVSRSSDLNWQELKFRLLPDAEALAALFKSRKPRRIFSIVRRLHRRYEFFKVLRVVEFIAFYARYTEIFEQGNVKLGLMSNHSNPHGVAFNLAARRPGFPVVLITHGMPIRPVARLTYDLAIVDNEAARQIYFEEGCRIDRIIIHGRQQNYSPMPNGLPQSLTVGIFLCKDINKERLRWLTKELLNQERVQRVLIRPHPKNLWTGLQKWIESLRDSRVTFSSGGSLFNDIQRVHIVLGGNSSVLVDAVTAGKPASFVAQLDHGPTDLHRFAASGLIFSVDDERGDLKWNPEAMLRFYQEPEWPRRLRLFSNIDEDQKTVLENACAHMRELAR